MSFKSSTTLKTMGFSVYIPSYLMNSLQVRIVGPQRACWSIFKPCHPKLFWGFLIKQKNQCGAILTNYQTQHHKWNIKSTVDVNLPYLPNLCKWPCTSKPISFYLCSCSICALCNYQPVQNHQSSCVINFLRACILLFNFQRMHAFLALTIPIWSYTYSYLLVIE